MTSFTELSNFIKDGDSISVYTNEFDLYMFRIFFPNVSSTLNYVPESIGFWQGSIPLENIKDHSIHIVRDYEQSESETRDREEEERVITREKIGNFTMITIDENKVKLETNTTLVVGHGNKHSKLNNIGNYITIDIDPDVDPDIVGNFKTYDFNKTFDNIIFQGSSMILLKLENKKEIIDNDVLFKIHNLLNKDGHLRVGYPFHTNKKDKQDKITELNKLLENYFIFEKEEYPSINMIVNIYKKRELEQIRNAYVYLVMFGDDYIKGALPSCYSMKNLAKTKYDCVCMVTPDVSRDARDKLSQVFDYVIDVDYLSLDSLPLRTEKQRNMYGKWITKSCTKWNCLSFTQYNKVIFMDADTIILKNIDSLFELHAPAGTFSNPWAKPFVPTGMNNPYLSYKHGGLIKKEDVDKGLNSFVLIGTTVLLQPDIKVFNDLVETIKNYKKFGFTNCNSATDEQFITWFYNDHLNIPFTFIHQKYNFIPWHKKWIGKETPYLLHFFNTKPWVMKRGEYQDLESFWQIVKCMIGEYPTLKNLYNEDDLLKDVKPNCFWCKNEDHNVISTSCSLECPNI